MRQLTIIFALIVAVGTTAHADKKSRKQKQIDRALWTADYYVLRENDPAAAAREYQKVLALDPQHVGAGVMLADLHLRQNKPKQAVVVLTKLSVKNARDLSVWRALGRARLAAGDAAGALASYRKALALSPGDAEAHWLVFELLDQRYRKGESAIKAELLEAARQVVAASAYQQGPHFDRAERTVVELSGDPLDLTVHDARKSYDAAFTESSWGAINQHMAAAREGFAACVDKQPDNQNCHYWLGMVHSSVKASDGYDLAKARKHLAKAANLPESHVQLARLARVADDLPGAQKALKRALELAPGHQRAMVELGIVYKLDGKDEAAQRVLASAVEIDAWSAAAAAALDELVKINPNHSLVKARMAYGAIAGDVFSSKRFVAAIDMVEEAYGGVDARAAEQPVLEEILARILDNADIDSEFSMKVAVLDSPVVNAMALPNGNIYFTRGLLDFVRKEWPKRKLDASNDVLGHVMGHEVAHVLRRHTVQSSIFQEAVKDAQRPLDAAVLTHVTRLQEIEADRVGIVLGFLAGFHPRGGVEFMEKSGVKQEIPPELDHPTYEERVQYLEDYWSNDVKFAFQAFSFGVAAMDRASRLEATDAGKAAAEYTKALEQFQTYRNTVKATKRVLNNMGVANAKLGLIAMAERGSPLHRWNTRFSIERESALAYVSVVRDDAEKEAPGGGSATRGRRKAGGPPLPRELKRALALFGEALEQDPGYARARLNLAATQIAAEEWAKADKSLGQIGKGARGAAWGDVLILRGVVAAETGKRDDARRSFEAAAKLKGSAAAAAYDLAHLAEVAGDKPAARAGYQAYVKTWPKGTWAAAAKARIKALR